MAIRSVNMGHWRALEETWLKEFKKSTENGTVAVVAAGSSQVVRLAELVPGSVSGARFFPGIPFLAKALAGSLTAPNVSVPQSIALAYHAGYQLNSAASAARFFENLLENGITAEMFETQSLSLRKPDPEVDRTAAGFLEYQKLRNDEFPFTPDTIQRKGPSPSGRYRTVMFYGFYDLNPGQRGYIKKLAASTDILWFSPIHPSHHWRKAFGRTLEFLKDLYRREDFHRVDGDHPLSSKAQFAENLLTGKALQRNHDVFLKRCGSGSAFTKAVISEILALNIPTENIAVVATGEKAASVRTELFCSGIPCETDLTAKASELPWGRLVLKLNALAENDFHHTDIEALLATGQVTAPETPGPLGYSVKAMETGARFGIEEMVGTGFPFAETIAEYFSKMPSENSPVDYLNRLTETLRALCPGSLPEYCFDVVLNERKFTFSCEVPFSVFRKMVEKALEEPVRIAEKQRRGIRILSPEKARGTLFTAVILTGMEEGKFPGRTVNDPRLPVEMKELLQMPSPDHRETEDAFLLRQVFEAAEEKLVILAESVDVKGNAVALSPFLARLKDEADNPLKNTVKRDNIPSMPSLTMDFPVNPPFLSSSMLSQRERLLFDYDHPSFEAVHCGMIGPGYFKKERISATLLENYLRDPFEFMVKNIWRAKAPEDFPVRSEPDPRNRGILVHKCVEICLSSNSPVLSIVKGISDEYGLEKMLGSEMLAEIWVKHSVMAIENLKIELNNRNWVYRGSEIRLEGDVAGYPAEGRIDLIFTAGGNSHILADLKTGKPGNVNSKNILEKNKLQLPFYRNLALQNGYTPVTAACYIHIQGNGEVTFEELTGAELESVQDQFEAKVGETVKKIRNGVFPIAKEKKWQGKGR